ncbi:hypothetical protein LOK49_LG09G00354 [Camellia lanceoleosa]|uniref:Uncharacterized protein n=1 Tax=Camellia lanceoleosa TaxID=1840588 RepID=A0ACC0GKJ5_9ERIC|nr:hypothetical protein LOK49_LG09G00354 [Camellia lanceoleosa]
MATILGVEAGVCRQLDDKLWKEHGAVLSCGARAEAEMEEGCDNLALVLQPLAVDRGDQEGLMGPTPMQVESSNFLGRNGIPAAEEVSDWVLECILEVSRLLGL